MKKIVAGGLGFEPRLTESESAVLPLNYPPPPAASPAEVMLAPLQDIRRRQADIGTFGRTVHPGVPDPLTRPRSAGAASRPRGERTQARARARC